MNQQLKSKFSDLIKGTSFPNNPDHYFKILMEFGQAAYDMAKADEWVSVDKALPEKDGRYLAYVKGGARIVEEGVYSLVFDSQNCFGRATHKYVTHWQPLPKSPNQ